MSWWITLSNCNCSYHQGKGANYCDLLSGGICEESECSMIDKFLKRYLLSHESDIASGENDYDELQGTLESVVGREARE